MNCADVERLVPDALANGLDSAGQADLQAHLEACPACREEWTSLAQLWARLEAPPESGPSPALRAGFYRMLEAATPPRPSRPWPRQAAAWAASLLLVAAGGFLGGFLARAPRALPAQGPELTLIHQGGADLRLAGVMLAAQGDPDNVASAEALLDLLDRDPQVEVRLAAVDALYLFGRQPAVRERLAASLGRQTSPRVQLALVDLLSGLREQRAMEALRALLGKPGTSPEVARRVQAKLADRTL